MISQFVYVLVFILFSSLPCRPTTIAYYVCTCGFIYTWCWEIKRWWRWLRQYVTMMLTH